MNNSLSNVSSPTLFSRLVKIISWLTFSIVLLFTGATLLITYSFEDVLFNERLKQAHIKIKNGESLPYDISVLDHQNVSDNQSAIYKELSRETTKSDNLYGEFTVKQRTYHYLITENGTILYDTTDVAIIDRALEDVFIILIIILIPSIFITYIVAKHAARYALKPFTVLTEIFSNSGDESSIKERVLANIKEQDVKQLASTLQDTLVQKAQLLEQQVMFNQGMAHELRTPLQVMQHSVELISSTHENLKASAAFERLQSSISRMNRLSDGMLWLTTDQEFSEMTNTEETINKCITALSELGDAHQTRIELNKIEDLELQIPNTVLELIVFNLFNNVVHHGEQSKNNTTWLVTINKDEVSFSNPVTKDANRALEVEHFGIGLTLILQLTSRFNLKTTIDDRNNYFTVTIAKK